MQVSIFWHKLYIKWNELNTALESRGEKEPYRFFVRLSSCYRKRSDSTQLIAILAIKPETTNKLVHLLQDLNSQSINHC